MSSPEWFALGRFRAGHDVFPGPPATEAYAYRIRVAGVRLGSSRASPAVRRNYFKHIVDLAVAHAEIAEVRPWADEARRLRPQRWVSRPAPAAQRPPRPQGHCNLTTSSADRQQPPHPDRQDFATTCKDRKCSEVA